MTVAVTSIASDVSVSAPPVPTLVANGFESLRSASTYLNNLLLGHGLLRNAKIIDFANPQGADGGVETTMNLIINLVHDLVQRHEAEQKHCESLSDTLQSLRSENARQHKELRRMNNKNEDLLRQLTSSQALVRTVNASAKASEMTLKSLRDEVTRLKANLAQLRVSCANDVRKRDVQITRLKQHLASVQRGGKSTHIKGGVTVLQPGVSMSSVRESSPALNSSTQDSPAAYIDIDDPSYTLRHETTEFLTQLSQNLSEENDNLIALVRRTLMILRRLQGLPEEQYVTNGSTDAKASLHDPGETHDDRRSFSPSHSLSSTPAPEELLTLLPTSFEVLESDMNAALLSICHMLTNPNFVSIDEVHAREEQIQKLRSGWEIMEQRWQEVISFMDTWRKRMQSNGNSIDLEELRQGLEMSINITPSMPFVRNGKIIDGIGQLQSSESGGDNYDDLGNDGKGTSFSSSELSDQNVKISDLQSEVYERHTRLYDDTLQGSPPMSNCGANGSHEKELVKQEPQSSNSTPRSVSTVTTSASTSTSVVTTATNEELNSKDEGTSFLDINETEEFSETITASGKLKAATAEAMTRRIGVKSFACGLRAGRAMKLRSSSRTLFPRDTGTFHPS